MIEGLLYALTAFVMFALVLGGLVLLHELGHFLTARFFNVRVLEFGIGFPPRAKVLQSRGETLVTLNWLPIGGFVRMDGEDGDGGDDPRSFSAQKLRVKLAILVAGVLTNIVTALAIFFLIAWLATPVAGVKIGTVEPSSPASAAGLVAGDEIWAVDGQRFDLFGGGGIVQSLRANAGRTVQLGIRHADGSEATVAATLRPQAELSAERGALGVSGLQGSYDYVGHDPVSSVGIAANELVRWSGLIIGGLGDLVGGFIQDPTAEPPAAGPIGIAVSLADVFLNVGPIVTLYVAGILSVNLGVVNLLPFPPLDGGRAAVLIIKRFFGSRVSLRAERLTYGIGFVILMAFILWVTGFDLLRLGRTQ